MPRYSDRIRDFEQAQLQHYTESYGKELPMDKAMFEPGAEHEGHCVFCGKPHAGHKVYRYDPMNDSRRATDNYACEECQIHIDQMLVATYPHFYEEDLTERDRIQSDRDSDFEASEYPTQRMYLYNSMRGFDDTVHYHYTHLNPSRDIYVRTKSNLKCYFCKASYVYAEAGWNYVEAPVLNSSDLTGGKVLCCPECEGDIWSDNGDHAETLLIPQRCTICKSGYCVEREEYDAREYTHSKNKHMCPKCTYLAVDALTPESFLFMSENNAPRAQVPMRYRWADCNFCHEQFLLDLTIDHDRLSIKHTTRLGALRCGSCYALRFTEANHNKFAFKFRDNIYIVLTKIGAYWTYHISIIIGDTEKQQYKAPEDLSQDDIECLFIAFEECQKLFPQPIQTSLWPNS